MVGPAKRFLASGHPGAVAVKYALFAAVSIGANLSAQWLAGRVYGGSYRIYVMLVVGTGVGLVVKYLLDKRYIFFFVAESPVHDLKTFMFYVAMGVLTTGLFWGTELLFDAVLIGEAAKYAGGAVGLTAGYITKYFLDRKWVFKT